MDQLDILCNTRLFCEEVFLKIFLSDLPWEFKLAFLLYKLDEYWLNK